MNNNHLIERHAQHDLFDNFNIIYNNDMSNLIILQTSIIFFKPHFKSTYYYNMCLSDEKDVRLNSIICQIENTLFWREKTIYQLELSPCAVHIYN